MRKKSWYNRAKEIQINFKTSELGLTKEGEHGVKFYPNILSISDCITGANFYCYNNEQEWIEMKEWVYNDTKKKMGFDKSSLRNMLRSEHISYNVFYPLEKLRITNHKKLLDIVQSIMDNRTMIKSIERIKIEYTPDKNRLNDKTSFDAYIEYKNAKGQLGALGIEIKYTEKSYSSNVKQKKALEDPNSIYNVLTTGNSSYYIDKAQFELRKNKLKQPWRNHLMGIALVEKEPKMLDEFFSVQFYPEQNIYQEEVCELYPTFLKEGKKNSFIPLTFQKFKEILKKEKVTDQWVSYFSKRYC